MYKTVCFIIIYYFVIIILQLTVLKEAHKSHPSGRWWIKADPCDVRKGLRESLRYQWNGDEDLGDGALQRLHTAYTKQRQFITCLGLRERERILSQDLDVVMSNFTEDEEFLKRGGENVRKAYEEKRNKQKSSEALLMTLAWDLTGFEELLAQCLKFKETVGNIKNRLSMPRSDQGNIRSEVSILRKQLLPYTKDLYGKRRTAATHLFVFMIADELRNMKPYAVPARVLPFKSISDQKVRELEEEIRNAMTSIGMQVVGKLNTLDMLCIINT